MNMLLSSNYTFSTNEMQISYSESSSPVLHAQNRDIWQLIIKFHTRHWKLALDGKYNIVKNEVLKLRKTSVILKLRETSQLLIKERYIELYDRILIILQTDMKSLQTVNQHPHKMY